MKKHLISRWFVLGSALMIIIYATTGTLLATPDRIHFAQANGTATTEAANATIRAALTAALTAVVATPTLDINATLAALQTREAAVNATLTALAPTHTPTETPTPTLLPSTPRTSIDPPTSNATATAAADASIKTAVAATLTAVAPPATATPTPIRDFTIGDTWTNPQDGAVYVYVPAGEFTMGSLDSESNEKPMRNITIDAFWLMQTEVTYSQYALCIDAGVCSHPRNSIWEKLEYAVHPVTDVNWYDANTYANWVEGRLPTEVEWEKAARGDDGRIYPWGNIWSSSRLNYCDIVCDYFSKDTEGADGYEQTAPVGSYLSGKSPYGALDMAGNVREWTSTLYADYPYTANDGRENLVSRGSRVVRGGSWRSLWASARTTRRVGERSLTFNSDLGFRVVRNQLPENAVISTPTPVSTPQITIPSGFTPVKDDARGYSLAVPLGWNPLDLRSTQFQNMVTTFGMREQIGALDGFLGSEAGQGFGVIYITDLTATLFGGLPTGLNVSVIDAPGATQAWVMQMLDAQLKANPAMVNDVEIRDLGPATVNNLPAVKGSATADLAQMGINDTIFVQIVSLIANDKIYILTLATTEQDMDKYMPIFDQIIGTFRPE